MRRILGVVALVAMLTACNGHEAAAKNQNFQTNVTGNTTFVHNHGSQGADTACQQARAAVKWTTSNPLQPEIRITLEYRSILPNGDAGSVPLTSSTGPWASTAGPYQLVRQSQCNPAGEQMEAVESIVEMRPSGGGAVFLRCEYHDPDGSNPPNCQRRDADGNPA